MEQFSGNGEPAGSRWYRIGRDLRPLENVEQHLRAQLEIERRTLARPASGHGVAASGQAPSTAHHALPREGAVLTGRLSSLAPTMDRQIYRAYLKNMGVTSVLYINFELGTCFAMALAPFGPV